MGDGSRLMQDYNMFTETWRFYRKWGTCEFPLSDGQWAQITAEAHEICRRYGYGKTIEYLMLAATQGLNEMERGVKA